MLERIFGSRYDATAFWHVMPALVIVLAGATIIIVAVVSGWLSQDDDRVLARWMRGPQSKPFSTIPAAKWAHTMAVIEELDVHDLEFLDATVEKSDVRVADTWPVTSDEAITQRYYYRFEELARLRNA